MDGSRKTLLKRERKKWGPFFTLPNRHAFIPMPPAQKNCAAKERNELTTTERFHTMVRSIHIPIFKRGFTAKTT